MDSIFKQTFSKMDRKVNLYKMSSDVHCGRVAYLFFFFSTIGLGRESSAIYHSDHQQRNLLCLKREVNMSHERLKRPLCLR